MNRWVLLASLAIVVDVHADVLKGTARDASGRVAYLERHDIRIDDRGFNAFIHVDYSTPEGQVFATMTSDFSRHLLVPDTVFEDQRFKIRTTLRIVGERIMCETETAGKLTGKRSFSLEDDMVASQGFDNFIRTHADRLSRKPQDFRFGVLSECDFFSLTGYRKTTSAADRIEYGIKAGSWLIGLFASELSVAYEASTGRLASFSGRSNIADTEGHSKTVDIRYQWERTP